MLDTVKNIIPPPLAVDQEVLCIAQVLERWAGQTPLAPMLLAPNREPLTYEQLWAQVSDAITWLHGAGIGRGDRVGVVMSWAPEIVVACLAVAACATCVPLDPSGREHEIAGPLRDLDARALLVLAGSDSQGIAAARGLDIPIIELQPSRDPHSWAFRLTGAGVHPRRLPDPAGPDDVAVILQTSGSTARPKLVPLTHANMYIGLQGLRRIFALQPDDRTLLIMPLFHSHGMISTLCLSLIAGASVVYASPFTVDEFFAALRAFRLTWYTAAPPVHQAILEQIEETPELIAGHTLRFVRSGSSAAVPGLLEHLEATFEVPVLEGFSMTEAHPITSTLLPPYVRKAGSVGVAVVNEIRIVGPAGDILPPGQTGEILTRGPVVTPGYIKDVQANQRAFFGDWFRTGDLGYMDEDGNLFLTGRLKDLIVRGAEKIAPREIEAVLLDHPAVADAVAFGMPHSRLGEQVAAAVTLRPAMHATEPDLRAFATLRLAQSKTPRRIVIVDALPRTALGKLTRTGLADQFGLTGQGNDNGLSSTVVADPLVPQDSLERQITIIWERVLGRNAIAVNENFFDLGGHSLLAVRLVEEIARECGRRLPVGILYEHGTIAQLSALLRLKETLPGLSSAVVLQPLGTGSPFFFVSTSESSLLIYRNLVKSMGEEHPLYGTLPRTVEGDAYRDLHEVAAECVAQIRAVQPLGPYHLGGVSFAGVLAFETAQQLWAAGEQVALLVLFDTFVPGTSYKVVEAPKGFLGRIRYHLGVMRALSSQESALYFGSRLHGMARKLITLNHRQLSLPLSHRTNPVKPRPSYLPGLYPGRITFFYASYRSASSNHELDPRFKWREVATGGFEVHRLPGTHTAMLQSPELAPLTARTLLACLARAGHPREATQIGSVLAD